MLGAADERYGPDARETRRVVTILFADVVGSTALGERLDPEPLRTVMNGFFNETRRVIERHGGTVEKYIGDAVMAVFGLPTSHEDDALRAVRSAFELPAAIESRNNDLEARFGLRLGLRIGVETGEVVAALSADRQRLVTGDAVNTAARLEQAAAPGDVLLGPVAERIVRDQVRTAAAGPLELKGKAEPVSVFRLLGIGDVGRSPQRAEARLVGRERELDALVDAFHTVTERRTSRLVTVSGGAGVGKSRLVREFSSIAGSDARVLRGRCLSYGDGISYWALTEIVRAAAGIGDEAPRDDRAKVEHLLGGGPDGARQAEVLAAVLGVSRTETSAEDIAWAFRGLLERLGSIEPLVLIVEDIHWADDTLLDLLESAAQWTRGVALLLLCVTRPELWERRPTWAASLAGAVALRLEPLGGADADALIEAQPGGSTLTASVRRRIADAAEGNPLFVEEVVALLLERGHGHTAEVPDHDNEVVEIPLTVHAVLAARLDSLATSEHRTIERASVVGRTFERSAVTALTPEAQRARVADDLIALARKDLVRTERLASAGDDAFRFRHVLIRDAAYHALTKAERADLHLTFADWLERPGGDHSSEYVEIAAYHLAAAAMYRLELGEVPTDLAYRAVRRVLEAADRSERIHAYSAAAVHLRRAFELRDALPGLARDGPDQSALLRRWAEACDLAGDVTDAVRLVDQAIETLGPEPDAERLADLLDRRAAHLWEVGDAAGAMRAVVDGLRQLPTEDSAIRATLLAAKARFEMLGEKNAAAVQTANAAIAMARASGARQTEGNALTSLGTAMCEIGGSDEGIAHIREALAIGLELGAVYDTMRALVNLTNVLSAAGRLDEAAAVAAEGLEHARRLGVERNTGVIFLHNMTVPASFKGDWAAVDVVQSQIEAYAPSGFNFLEFLGVGVLSASDRGDQVRAAELLAQARRSAMDWGIDRFDELFLRHEIVLALRSGDPTRAATLGRPPVGHPNHPHVAWLIAQAQAARLSAAGSARDSATIRAIVDDAAVLLGEVDQDIAARAAAGWPWRSERLPPALAARAELTGILSGPDPASWTEALVEARRSGFRPLEADLLLGRAKALEAVGSPRTEIEADLEASLAIAEDLGYQPTVDRVRAQLEQLRTQGSKP